jgi:YD repeat-containing protein
MSVALTVAKDSALKTMRSRGSRALLWVAIGSSLGLSALASTVTYTYDDAGRLVRVDRDTGPTTTTSYTLDPAGNRKTVKDSDGSTPTVPTGLTATAISPTQINLAWTASTDNTGVTGYIIERCQGSGCVSFAAITTVIGAPPATSYSDTAVVSTTMYSYRVRAQDAAGNVTNPSNVATTTSLDGTPPSAPSALSASVASATRINLSWTASTDNIGVTGYAIERCTGSGCSTFAQIGTVVGSPPVSTYADTTVVQLTTYGYRVRAYDARTNYSPYSNTVVGSTPDGAPPTAPGGLTATGASSTLINLSWTASTDNVGVQTYFVERCAGSGCSSFAQIATVAAPTTTYANSALAPSSTYVYRVRANDAAGNLSAYSSSATGTTLAGVPSPPTISPVNLQTTLTTYSLSWTASSGATSYKLFSSTDNVTYTLKSTTAATSQSVTTGLGDFYYKVEACNTAGCSAFSNRSHVLVCSPSGCL